MLKGKCHYTTDRNQVGPGEEQTSIAVFVSIQSGKGLVAVPGEGVPCIAVIQSQPQSIPVALWFHIEAVILSKHLPATPIFQGHPQLILSLFGQPVQVFQTKPVLSI